MPPNSLETGVCHVLIYGSYVWLALQVLATLWLYILWDGLFLNLNRQKRSSHPITL